MIAFAYADTGPKRSALYRSLIEGLTKNIQENCPQDILMVTDDDTKIVKGATQLLRVPRIPGLMTWRLKCHQMAHAMADEILFVEPDVRFTCNVMPDFEGDFDVSITTREKEVMLDNQRVRMPYAFGVMFSRSAEFWRQAKLICQTLSTEDQDWFGDMFAIRDVIESGKFNVRVMDGSIYNHVVNDPSSPTTAKVLHYKGKRKQWLLPQAVEA